MAIDLSAVTAVLNKKFENELTNNINRATALFQVLPGREAMSDNVKWVAKFGTAAPSTAKIADGADVTVFNNDDRVPASLGIGTYHDAFSITGKALAAAAASGNPAQLVDLFRDEMQDSLPRLAMAIAKDCYTGTGAVDEIHGLLHASGGLAATGTYAGINRTTYAQWASNVDANGAVDRPLSIDLMRKMRRLIYIASGMKPDVIVCDPVQHEKYGALLGDKRRYLEEVTIRGRKVVLDGGYATLEFDGIPVIEDINCPAKKMLFLNTRFVDVFQLPHPSETVSRAMGETQLKGTAEEQFGETALPIKARLQPLAVAGDKFKFANYAYPQIRVRRPNASGVLADLAE